MSQECSQRRVKEESISASGTRVQINHYFVQAPEIGYSSESSQESETTRRNLIQEIRHRIRKAKIGEGEETQRLVTAGCCIPGEWRDNERMCLY